MSRDLPGIPENPPLGLNKRFLPEPRAAVRGGLLETGPPEAAYLEEH